MARQPITLGTNGHAHVGDELVDVARPRVARPTAGSRPAPPYDPDADFNAASFRVPVEEYVKRFNVRDTITTEAGVKVHPGLRAVMLEPIRESERWRPRVITSVRDLRAFFESDRGQHKRFLESGDDFDTGETYGRSATHLIDHEFVPTLAGPFSKQLYLTDYLQMHARCLVGSTPIPLLDGTTVTIEQLAHERRRNFWVYSCDAKGRVVPGLAKWAKRTGRDQELVSVLLDNGETIECTPDHLFMLRDGSYRQAQKLLPDDSLMPLYRKTVKGYEHVYQPCVSVWEPTHKRVAMEYTPDERAARVEKWRKSGVVVTGKGFKRAVNHRVVSVRSIGRADVYDLTVEKHHNFAVGQGVFVHNSFELKNHNALAASANKIMTRFVLGRGLSFHVKNNVAHKIWNEFWDRETMRRKLRHMTSDLMWQGELLLRFYEPRPGHIGLRNLDASTCWEVVTDPEDIERVYYYHFQWPTPYQVWVSGNIPVSKYIIQQVPPTNIVHVKINESSQEKRGRSDLLPSMPWLKRFNDFYNGQTVKALLEANLVWKIKVRGDQTDVDKFLTDPSMTELPPPGGVWIENESVELSPSSAQLTANRGSGGIGQQIAAIVATSLNLPAEYFNIETGGAPRATALVRTDPAVKAVEDRQQIMRETLEDIYDRVIAAALQAGRIRPSSVRGDPELVPDEDDGPRAGAPLREPMRIQREPIQ